MKIHYFMEFFQALAKQSIQRKGCICYFLPRVMSGSFAQRSRCVAFCWPKCCRPTFALDCMALTVVQDNKKSHSAAGGLNEACSLLIPGLSVRARKSQENNKGLRI